MGKISAEQVSGMAAYLDAMTRAAELWETEQLARIESQRPVARRIAARVTADLPELFRAQLRVTIEDMLLQHLRAGTAFGLAHAREYLGGVVAGMAGQVPDSRRETEAR